MKQILNVTFRTSFVCFLALFLQLAGCSQNKKPEKFHTNKNVPVRPSISEIRGPANGSVFKCGETIPINFIIKNNTVSIDSIVISSGSYLLKTYKTDFNKIAWPTINAPVGQNILKITTCYNDSLKDNKSVVVTLLSNIIPKLYKFHLIHTYHHDPEAFTQGLIYDNGTLLESTGQNGHSSLRRVEITTGKVLDIVNLDAKYFGEGIALIQNKIYQITWKAQTGFIYDKKTFDVLRTFDFPYYEGWGLTSHENNLYMTDGTSFVYVIEPEYFTQKRQIDVLNHKGRVTQLNELEYVHGKILANVLGESYIVVIDPANGKVTGELELKRLIPKGMEGEINKVLNGIAYNKETNHFYVTGKLWPVLYEIEIEGEL